MRRLAFGCTCTLALLGCTGDRKARDSEPVAFVSSALSAPTKLHAFPLLDGGVGAPSTPVPMGGKAYFAGSD